MAESPVLEHWNKMLIHSCQCRDANCRFIGTCQHLKRVVQHAKECKKSLACPTCSRLRRICIYHAKHCQEAECYTFFCTNIKKKLQHQQLHQAQILKRRIATMQNPGMSDVATQTSPGNSNSSNQSSLGAQPNSSPHPPQPGIGVKPSSAGLPFGVLQAVQQVQAAATRQTAPHMITPSVNYTKNNPVVSPLATNTNAMTTTQQMQAQMQKSMPQMMSGTPNRMVNISNVACWEGSGYAQIPQPHQNAQLQTNPGPSLAGMQRPTQAWQQLLQTLKSSKSAQQQQQALANLKSNPQLIAAFIKQKTAQQQQQQHVLLTDGSMIAPPQSVRFKEQQHITAMQQQQQSNQFPHLRPPMYPQRLHMPIPIKFGHQLGFQGDGSQFQFQQQPQQILMQPQKMLGLRQPSQLMGGHNSSGNPTIGPPPQVMPNPGPSLVGMQRPTQAWQQLVRTLMFPPSAQQQQQFNSNINM